MHVRLMCSECIFEKRHVSVYKFEYRDGHLYEWTCNHGHENSVVMQQLRHEILFEIGGFAILDGYYREATVSFASSLERFYEFCLRVFLVASTGRDEAFKRLMRHVRRSEPQFGAFAALWLDRMGSVAEVLPVKRVEFRNDVVHNGRIPTKQEAIEFGQSVLSLIRPKVEMLKEKFPDAIQRVISYHVSDMRLTAKLRNSWSATCSKSMLLDITVTNPYSGSPAVEEWISQLEKTRAAESVLDNIECPRDG